MDNALLDLSGFIPFGSFNNTQLAQAITIHLEKAVSTLAEIESRDNVSWNDLQTTLYPDLYKLNQVWGILGHLESVTDKEELRQLQEKFQPLITDFYVNLGQSAKLYHHYKQIKQTEYTQLGAEEQKIVDNEFRDFFLSGITLAGEQQAQFKNIQNQLSQLSTKFSQNLLDATDRYKKYVTSDELPGVPADVLTMFSNAASADKKDGLYKITLHMSAYLPVMQYCQDRNLREELYYQYITRASELAPAKFDNAPFICQILQLRQQKARLLGFDNYALLSLYTKMADNTKQVTDFLYQLADKSKANALKDLAELKAYALQECRLDKLEIWDIPFVSEKLHQQKYSYSNHELKQYFPVNSVINGLFELIYKLYKVEFKNNSDIPVWDKDMQTYDILRDNKVIGHLYMDLYTRNGKHSGAWMNSVQDRFISVTVNKKPIAFIICNFTPPNEKNQSLLTFDEVQTIFHEMGHALHHLLSQINHPSISGINGVEWDAVELPSQFMEYFTWNYTILQSISCHVVSGESIPIELYNKMLSSRHYHSGLQMLRQLEFALLDISLHSNNINTIDDVRKLVDEIKTKITIIFPPQFDRSLNSFSHIFAGGYAAGYYSYKWAEVLAMDIFSIFDECGENSYTELGQKFYTTILSQGGLKPMLENFITFMGREPRIDALLKYSGIDI